MVSSIVENRLEDKGHLLCTSISVINAGHNIMYEAGWGCTVFEAHGLILKGLHPYLFLV